MIHILEGQSMLDIAIQENGSIMAAFELALANGLSITDELGSQLSKSIPKKEYESLDITSYLEITNQRNEIVNVIESQSVLDIAIQMDGNVLSSFEWALNNGLSITDDLAPVQKIKMPKSEEFRFKDLANYFNNRNIATGYMVDNSDLPILPEGIGAMIIGTSFIVN